MKVGIYYLPWLIHATRKGMQLSPPQIQAQIYLVNKSQPHPFLCSRPFFFPGSYKGGLARASDFSFSERQMPLYQRLLNWYIFHCPSVGSSSLLLLSGSWLFFAYVHLLLPIIRTLYFILFPVPLKILQGQKLSQVWKKGILEIIKANCQLIFHMGPFLFLFPRNVTLAPRIFELVLHK